MARHLGDRERVCIAVVQFPSLVERPHERAPGVSNTAHPNASLTVGRLDRWQKISLIACSPSGRLKPLAPVFPNPRVREPTAIRLAAGNRATI